MANIKSQIKRNRQNEKARLRNKSVKSSLKTVIRKLHEASAAGDTEKATVLLRDASRKLDKAVSEAEIQQVTQGNFPKSLANEAAQAGGTCALANP